MTRWTAHQLQSRGADVFCLQEMWNPVSVQRALTSAGVADHNDLLEAPGSNGQHATGPGRRSPPLRARPRPRR